MRNNFVAAAALTIGVALLAGCQKQAQPAEAPAPPAPAAAATAAPDQALPADLSLEANQKFLNDNKAKPGVMVRPSGLQYRVITAGKGAMPTSGDDLVTVTYKGSLINGKVFDQTPPGQTAQFPAGQLIQGWVEALSLMKEGDEWELVIPGELGYGPDGAKDPSTGQYAIPPNQALIFDMTLMKVDHAPAAAAPGAP